MWSSHLQRHSRATFSKATPVSPISAMCGEGARSATGRAAMDRASEPTRRARAATTDFMVTDGRRDIENRKGVSGQKRGGEGKGRGGREGRGVGGGPWAGERLRGGGGQRGAPWWVGGRREGRRERGESSVGPHSLVWGSGAAEVVGDSLVRRRRGGERKKGGGGRKKGGGGGTGRGGPVSYTGGRAREGGA